MEEFTREIDERIVRMKHALNGPTNPNMPKASSFMVEDAEAEIRRNVNRHYQQQADIAELTTDRDHWRNEATLHKAEVERLQAKQKDAETLIDELKAGMARLHAQFETGAQIWLTGYRTLAELTQLKVVTPPALEQITHQKDSSHENEGGSNSSR